MLLDKILETLTNGKRGFAILFVITATIVFIFFIFKAPSEAPPKPTPTPSPTQINLEKDYSHLNKIIPGKSTLDDLIRINGKPASTKASGGKAYVYYKTPLEGFTNTILLENNIVVYSLENVFGSYRGNVSEYEKTYGEPDITLYDRDLYSWYIYLDAGIAIENDGKEIGTMLYFIPQDKQSFMETIAKELNLLEKIEIPPFETDPIPESE
ncbi:MAG: hypothetical protein HYV38_00265 [Candidatus Levybacteria bacterium]|nr:hypothetical protein [Candidatus Levybacteria bacterium]